MELNEFEIGTTYQIQISAWEAPNGEKISGKTLTRRILEPANKENSTWLDGPAPERVIEQWQDFLRVEEPASGMVHLLHPKTIETAVALS